MNPNHRVQPLSDCDAILELIPDYAFGLTSPEDTRLVESKLASCPEASAQLAEYKQMQAEMRANVPQVEPPPHLRSKLLAATALSDNPAQKSRRTLGWVVAAAALAAVLALIVSNLYWFTRVNELIQQNDELIAQLRGQSGPSFVLSSTNNLRWVRLPASQEDSTASAFLMWDAQSETGLMYAQSLPELEPGKTYQLWLTRGDERVSAGVFQVDEEGKGSLLFHANEPIDAYTWARITAEPEYGSPEPSEDVVVVGQL